jgi:hypothetical protein
VDAIFGRTLFGDDDSCLRTWTELPLHPLQEDEPGGDRHWIESSPALQVKEKIFSPFLSHSGEIHTVASRVESACLDEDSNLRPSDSEADTLPFELPRQNKIGRVHRET